MAVYVPHLTYQQFRQAVLGRRYDLDGVAGAQCYDGAYLLYQQPDIGQFLYTQRAFDTSLKGYVKTCWTDTRARSRNASGVFVAVSRLQDVKKGDVLVLNTYPNWYGTTGHICYADEDYNGSDYMNILGQNQGMGSNPYTGTPFNIQRSYIGNAFLGAFRYTAWASAPSPEPEPEPEPSTSVYNRSRYNFVLFNRRKRQEKWIRKPSKRR